MTKEQLSEESLIDLAFAILEEKKAPIPFDELIKIMQDLTGHSNAIIKSRIVQFYTDLNVDGRFLLENDKGWGLREWYKVEQIEEETAPSVKTRKKKSKVAAIDEDLEEDLDEEDLDLEEDFEEFVEDDEEDEDEVEEVIEFEEDIEDIDEDIDEELIDTEDEFEIEDDEIEDEELEE